MAFLAIFALNFHSGVCTTTTSCFKMYFPCKIWEKPIDNVSSFTFFHNIGPNLALILPQDHFVIFFAGFQWNMLEDSININNFTVGLSGLG